MSTITTRPLAAGPVSQRSIAAGARSYLAAAFAILFGAFVIYGVGFAGPSAIHNAAHDVRHAFAFPCH